MKSIKRRTFLKYTMMGTGIIPVLGQVPESINRPLASARKKIIVAGAGITGLCCAYELMKNGHEVVVLEATGRYGGHVFTGRDGLSDGLYADFGADHITKPGYEKLFDYVSEFNLTALPYPHAEGSEAAPNRNGLRMINGKFYSDEQMADASVLRQFGYNDKEVKFLEKNKWYALGHMYLKPYLGKIKDPDKPFGVGVLILKLSFWQRNLDTRLNKCLLAGTIAQDQTFILPGILLFPCTKYLKLSGYF